MSDREENIERVVSAIESTAEEHAAVVQSLLQLSTEGGADIGKFATWISRAAERLRKSKISAEVLREQLKKEEEKE